MENALRTMMTGIRGRILAGVLIIGIIPVAAPLFADTGSEELAPVARHEKIGQLVTEFIQKSHYRHAAVDDDLSSQVLDRYVEALDNKSNVSARVRRECVRAIPIPAGRHGPVRAPQSRVRYV